MCIVDAAAAVGVVDQLCDFVGSQLLAVSQFHHFAMERAFAGEEGMKQRQGDFPFAKVVAGGFADVGIVVVVENVVANLETEA